MKCQDIYVRLQVQFNKKNNQIKSKSNQSSKLKTKTYNKKSVELKNGGGRRIGYY